MKDGKDIEGAVNSNEFSTTKFSEYGILVEKDVPKLIAVGQVPESLKLNRQWSYC